MANEPRLCSVPLLKEPDHEIQFLRFCQTLKQFFKKWVRLIRREDGKACPADVKPLQDFCDTGKSLEADILFDPDNVDQNEENVLLIIGKFGLEEAYPILVKYVSPWPNIEKTLAANLAPIPLEFHLTFLKPRNRPTKHKPYHHPCACFYLMRVGP